MNNARLLAWDNARHVRSAGRPSAAPRGIGRVHIIAEPLGSGMTADIGVVRLIDPVEYAAHAAILSSTACTGLLL